MPSVDEAEVIEYLDDLLSHLQLKERLLIRGLVALLEVQMLALNGLTPRLFTQATFEERTRNLAGWETSRLFQRRLVFMAIRTLLLWAYADSQEVERSMGFVPGTRRTAERQAAIKAAAEGALRTARGNADLSPPPRDASPNDHESNAPMGSHGLDVSRAAKSSSK